MNGRVTIIRVVYTAIAVAFLTLCAVASAQPKAMVQVPFAFTANHRVFPAGYYKLELLTDRMLYFTDNSGIIIVRPESVPYIETRGVMRFLKSEDRNGNWSKKRRYLTEVWFAGTCTHSVPVLQRTLAREIAEQQKADANIEIAMREK